MNICREMELGFVSVLTGPRSKEGPGRNASSVWCLVYMRGEATKQRCRPGLGHLGSVLTPGSGLSLPPVCPGGKEGADFRNILLVSLGGWPQTQAL